MALVVGIVGTTRHPGSCAAGSRGTGCSFNHACFVIAAVSSGAVLEVVRTAALAVDVSSAQAPSWRFLGTPDRSRMVSSPSTALLSITAVYLRTVSRSDQSGRRTLAASRLSLSALAPLAWLMAQVFQLPNGVGWWATPLFVVPLFTTRLAYARYVETRELFEQTIEALSKAVDARDRYTRNHSSRVSFIAEAMSRVMRLRRPRSRRSSGPGCSTTSARSASATTSCSRRGRSTGRSASS